jgi:hypothetical protein
VDARQGRLRGLSPSWRVLITGFLAVLGAGYLSGALNAALAVGLTPAGIGDHYRDQTLSHAEEATMAEQGFVEEEFSFDTPEPAASDEMAAHDHEHMEGVEGSAMPGMMEGGGRSITPQQLAQLSHVHLLGFSFILLSVGALACLTTLGEALKVVLVAVLAVSLGVDIGGLWLVRFVSDGYAWITAVSGTAVGVCLLVTSARVLWEVWFCRPEESAT